MGLQDEYADKLISMVYERRAIWDSKDANYHNRVNRKVLWDEICAELNVNLEDLYRRWKSLKDTFLKEYKKEQLYGRKNRWAYYESLMFLKDRFKHKTPEEETQSSNEHEYFADETEDAVSGISGQYRRNNNDSHILTNHRDSPHSSRSTKRPRMIRKYPSHVLHASFPKDTADEFDPDYYFMMSLLPYMQNVPPERKMNVRMRIQQVFYEEQQLQTQSARSATTTNDNVELHENVQSEGETVYINTITVDNISDK